MTSAKNIKVAVIGIFTILFFIWMTLGTLSQVSGSSPLETANALVATSTPDPNEYVGTQTCAVCHDEAFKSFADTKHAGLADIKSWKDKVQGCESCHGPGKKHSDDPKITNIISFKNKNSKQISESCLACHAGKEEHNNFRRGDHWRNNIGCTDCHTAHGASHPSAKADSITFIDNATRENPGFARSAMLKSSEPQLCVGCHSEVKAQFSKPFRHRVMEGAMKCSDCHNPHGGFETKQTRLTLGADSTCIKCHSDKQGPFVFEHAPLKIEGCSACHTPHGSANPKMLKRSQVRQLCLECHSSITEQFAPDVPSFHNQAVLRYQNCTICHAAIHGSNTSKDFFR